MSSLGSRYYRSENKLEKCWSSWNLHRGGVTDHKQSEKSSRNCYVVVSTRKKNRLSKGTESGSSAGFEGVFREGHSEEVTR